MITPALFGSLSAQPHYLGIDLGGSSIKAAAIAQEGSLLSTKTKNGLIGYLTLFKLFNGISGNLKESVFVLRASLQPMNVPSP